MEETPIKVEGLEELIELLTDSNSNQTQAIELLTETNGYIDTEITDLLAALNGIQETLSGIFFILVLAAAWKLAAFATSVINGI